MAGSRQWFAGVGSSGQFVQVCEVVVEVLERRRAGANLSLDVVPVAEDRKHHCELGSRVVVSDPWCKRFLQAVDGRSGESRIVYPVSCQGGKVSPFEPHV